ncbi:hypothetical protein BHM03_00015575, partial [Ensete ventricosum]
WWLASDEVAVDGVIQGPATTRHAPNRRHHPLLPHSPPPPNPPCPSATPRRGLKVPPGAFGGGGEPLTAMANVEAGTGGAGKRAGGGAYYYEEAEAEERAWTAWLVPLIVVACVAVFVAEMYVNNCPAHPGPFGSCTARFLHRVSFQPVRENPLLGPSSST